MEKLSCEEWRTVDENHDYEVSNEGRVRVRERVRICGNGNARHVYPAKIMSTFLHDNGKGNKNVVVQMRDGKRQVRRSVASLVLLAFVGIPPKNAKQPKHLDGNPLNNCLSNLAWDVDKAYGMPPNKTAREYFDKYAYNFIRAYVAKNGLWRCKMYGYLNVDDFIQECAIAIWGVIDLYDEKKCSFMRFVFIKCDFQFKKMYEKYVRRQRIAPTVYFSDMEREYMPLDHYKELSYEEKFYGD